MGLKSLFLQSINFRKIKAYPDNTFLLDNIKKKYKTVRASNHYSISPHYEWVRDEQLMEYILSKDYDTFCIGYQILLEKGIIKEDV